MTSAHTHEVCHPISYTLYVHNFEHSRTAVPVEPLGAVLHTNALVQPLKEQQEEDCVFVG